MYRAKYYPLFLFLFIPFSLLSQFAAEQNISSTLGKGQDVFTADFDNDNALDVLVGAESFLYWQRNIDGTGLFEKPIIIDEGELDFKSVHAADLDDDGDMDILTVSMEDAWVAYYENLGDGVFGERTILFQDEDYAAVVYTADIDNDGDVDVLAGTRQASPGPGIRLRWFKNNGDLNFGNPQIITFIGSSKLRTTLNAADLNNDGFVDLISTDANADNVRIMMNDGDGTFTPSNIVPTDSSMRMHGTVIADFDNDGAMDIFYIDYYSAQIYFKNNGDGTFSEVMLPQFSAGIGGDPLDYDNDGDIDIVLVSFGSGTSQGGGMRILNNDGNGVFTLFALVIAEGIVSSGVAAGDLNNDGFTDFTSITGLNSFNEYQQVVWYENNNGVDFLPVKTISGAGKEIFELGLYDFNNDQIQDMYMVALIDQKITWMEGLGNKTFGTVHTVGYLNGGLGQTVLADFDGDGDKDFISTDQTTTSGTNTNGHLYFFENDGMGNFSEETFFPNLATSEDIENVQFADFDQDADLDLIVYQSLSPEGKVSIMENLGNGNYGTLTELASFATTLRTLLILDLDADGLEDVLMGERSNEGNIYWLKNLGGNNFAAQASLVTTNNSDFFDFKIVDIDYDNDLDILAAAQQSFGGTGELILYKNNGDNTFDNGTSLASFFGAFYFTNGVQYAVGDIDWDGDLDIVFGHATLDYIKQEADGSFSDKIPLMASFDGNELLLDDLDNDGDLDALIAYADFDNGALEKISLLESYANNASLSGFLFYDENNNGSFDGNELKIAHQSVDITPGAIAAYTTDEGDYKFYVNEGDYTITPQLDDCWTLTTTPINYEVTTNGIDLQEGFNFGTSLNTGDEQVAIQMISAPTRCSFTVPFWLTATNKGCTIADGYAQLVLSDLVALQTVEPAPDETIGDTLRWNYSNLFPEEKRSVLLTFEIADASNIGEFIEMPLSTHYDNGGNVELGKEFLFESEINCAYDPNDKQVYPARSELGYEADYLIPEEPLLYTIRFQNTGTDTAFNIVIRDQLSTNLDWTTFQPESASHLFESTLDEDGLAAFYFRDILLVDSFTNEPASHGFVNFSIQPLPGLTENTVINNTAGIYFDFNAPIITNTVENVFVQELPTLLPPTASFSASTNGLEAAFTNLSTNNPTSSSWNFGDGSMSNDFSPTHTYAGVGVYDVCLTVTNDNGSDTSCESLEFITSNIHNHANDNRYVLMPNPAKESMNLTFEQSLPTNLFFELYDVTGQQIGADYQMEDKKAVFNLNHLPQGTYFIRGIVDGTTWLTDYFVVQ